MTTSTERAPSSSAGPNPELTCHVNTVELVGELAAPAEVRQLPNGDEVVGCRLVVRTESISYGRGSKAVAPVRSDSIDCAASAGALRKRLLSYQAGDVLELSGALRHRYWRGAGGLNSRYEVEVNAVRRRRRGDV